MKTTLPKYYLITNDANYNKQAFLKKLIMHLKHGQKLIQLRAKNITFDEFIDVAKASIFESQKYGATLILNTNIKLAKQLNADGIHLSSYELMKLNKRPLPQNKLISAACHNEIQLQHAKKIDVDFVTLSPVLKTHTHPETTPLGWQTFSKLVKSVNLPIYALGNLSESDLNVALNYGACGVAAITALWDKKYLT